MSNGAGTVSEGADGGSRFTSGTAIVTYLAAAIFLLHLVFSRRYGYFVDELYYLACSEHLDCGQLARTARSACALRIEQHSWRRFSGRGDAGS